MPDLLARIEDLWDNCKDVIQDLIGRDKSSHDPYDCDDLSAPRITAEHDAARLAAYERLKASFPHVGPYESGRHIYSGDSGARACVFDFGGVAAIVERTTMQALTISRGLH